MYRCLGAVYSSSACFMSGCSLLTCIGSISRSVCQVAVNIIKTECVRFAAYTRSLTPTLQLQTEAAEYGRLYAQRQKEAKEARRSIISKRRSSRKASAKVEA